MSLPELNDTESWAALVKNRKLPRAKPSDYVQSFMAMRENGRRLEELLLAHKIKTIIEAISRKYIKTHEEKGFLLAPRAKGMDNKKLVDWTEDVVSTVASDLLYALMKPGSSGQRGLAMCFGLTVRRKTDTVLKKPEYRQKKIIAASSDALLEHHVDADAANNMEMQVMAQNARAKLAGRRAAGFDTATGVAVSSGADPEKITRHEKAAKDAVMELLEVAGEMRAKEAPRRVYTAKDDLLAGLEKLKLPGPPDASEFFQLPDSKKWFHISKKFARAILLEDEKDELPFDWRERAYAALQSIYRAQAARDAEEPPIAEAYYPDDHELDQEEKAYWACLTAA